MRRCIVAVAILLWLGACSANNNSIFRTYEVGDEKIGLIDAKQRAILSNKRKKTTRTDRRTTNVDTTEPESRKTEVVEESTTVQEPLTRFCVEPSPDVFTVLSSSLAVSGAFQSDAVSQSVAANLAAEISEAGATISRTQTIQTLRELMYRTCERYLNGAISEEEFSIQAGRDHRIVVSILAIEQLTNAVRPAPVAIAASSKANTAKDLVAINEQLSAARAGLKKKQDAAATSKQDAEKKQKAYEDLKQKQEEQKSGARPVTADDPAVNDEQVAEKKNMAQEAAKEAERNSAAAADAQVVVDGLEELLRSPSEVRVSGETAIRLAAAQAVPETVSDTVATAIGEIVQNNFDLDEVALFCIRYLGRTSKVQDVQEFCTEYVRAEKLELQERSQRLQATIQFTDDAGLSASYLSWLGMAGNRDKMVAFLQEAGVDRDPADLAFNADFRSLLQTAKRRFGF